MSGKNEGKEGIGMANPFEGLRVKLHREEKEKRIKAFEKMKNQCLSLGIDLSDAYCCSVIKCEYIVRLEEKIILIETENNELIPGYESTLYNVFDNSVVFTQKSKFQLGERFHYYNPERINVPGYTGELSFLIKIPDYHYQYL